MSPTPGDGPATTGPPLAGRDGDPPSRAGGLLLGLGLGGFVDGILLHQILQWHHMVSHDVPPDTVAGLQLNTLADGLFHTVAWVLVVAGSVATVAAWRRGRLAPGRRFHLGLVLAGWGSFSLVEGLVNHHLLQVHHVRDDLGGPLSWDVGFLVVGVLLLAGGWSLHRQGLRSMLRATTGGADRTHRGAPLP